MTMDSIDCLLGKTLIKIVRFDDDVIFFTSEGKILHMYHKAAWLKQLTGYLQDLIKKPILIAERTTYPIEPCKYNNKHILWTNFILSTKQDNQAECVVARWRGESNIPVKIKGLTVQQYNKKIETAEQNNYYIKIVE